MAIIDALFTVSNAVKGFKDVPEFEDYIGKITSVRVQVQSGILRFRQRGLDNVPTTSFGETATANTRFTVTSRYDVQSFTMIRDGTENAVLFLTAEVGGGL